MTKLTRIPAALLLFTFLIGCGQNGPLYVTGNPSTVEPINEPQNTETEDDSEDDEADRR